MGSSREKRKRVPGIRLRWGIFLERNSTLAAIGIGVLVLSATITAFLHIEPQYNIIGQRGGQPPLTPNLAVIAAAAYLLLHPAGSARLCGARGEAR
jgi:hypothetical protein